MRIVRWFRSWRAARRERRIGRLTRLAMRLDADCDLVELARRGFVAVSGSGSSITRVLGLVESRVRRGIRVVVHPGTYLVARGNFQNMVATREHRFYVGPLGSYALSVPAACIDPERPIPATGDRFSGVKRVSSNVARFMAVAEYADPMVIQAGVWALMSGSSGSDIQRRLVTVDRLGNRTAAITKGHVEAAAEILDQLGLNHRLRS